MCVCTWIWKLEEASAVAPQAPSTLFYNKGSPTGVCHRLGWLASEPQGSAFLHMPPCKHGASNSDLLACVASALPTKVFSQSLASLHKLHVTKNSEEARDISKIIWNWLPANGAELSYVFLFLMSVIAVVLQLALQHQLMKMCLLCSELDKGIR